MARLLDDGVRLNFMSLEALAAAENHGADLWLAALDKKPQPLTVSAARGRPAPLMGR